MDFSGIKILVIGDVMIDAYLWGNVDRISPEAPIPVVAVNQSERRLGGAANVALNVKALGAEPLLCTVVGSDAEANMFSDLMTENGLDTEGMLAEERRVTTVKTRILSRNHQMFRFDAETTKAIQKDTEAALLAKVAELIDANNVQAVILQDYNKGIFTPSLIRSLIDLCNEKNVPTAVDPKKENFMAYTQCTLFKPNLKEIRDGMDLSLTGTDEKALQEAANRVHAEFDNRITLFTLAEEGVYVSDNGNGQRIPAIKRNVADVSGAGDTVISVAAVALAAGMDAVQLAKLANVAGGLVCEYVGVVPIDKDRLSSEASTILNE